MRFCKAEKSWPQRFSRDRIATGDANRWLRSDAPPAQHSHAVTVPQVPLDIASRRVKMAGGSCHDANLSPTLGKFLMALYRMLRPLLFSIDAEHSHALALKVLKAFGAWPGAARPAPGRPRTLMGVRFPNAVGLAAGLDKDGVAALGLARLGFGHIELGTVTPRPQPGNPQPRLFRLPEAGALINRMGFNNAGAAALAERLAALKRAGRMAHTPIGVNIGKSKATPLAKAAEDYLACMEALHPWADYLTVNLSSPNTLGLRTLQYGDALDALLGALKELQARLASRRGRYVPFCLKVAPDLEDDALGAVAEAVLHFEVDGVVAGNATTARPLPAGLKHRNEAGGLSGVPLAPTARRTVAELRQCLGPERPIIGCGGILSLDDAQGMLNAGADMVQIYTGLVYRGPSLLRTIAALERSD